VSFSAAASHRSSPILRIFLAGHGLGLKPPGAEVCHGPAVDLATAPLDIQPPASARYSDAILGIRCSGCGKLVVPTFLPAPDTAAAGQGRKPLPFTPAPAAIKPEWYFMFMSQTLKYPPAQVLGFEGEVVDISWQFRLSTASQDLHGWLPTVPYIEVGLRQGVLSPRDRRASKMRPLSVACGCLTGHSSH
jgi:hypothetical protein